ncbi:RDD family protein [Salipaludibacillus sp. CUR1]|uniref:RDD family protein n=1 Tax=Salipaludibacillus sp. CUR1 TaxID=2820003 RepID=UPI001E2D49C8|nr:RDD family protein [Salipaludibacillus sp. CUR1]MCE7793341.1 RDD family protein [Salipaludibacillus sp. CUR1]
MNEEHNSFQDNIKNEETSIVTEEEITVQYAGFWMRFWAYIVDLIVVSSINGLVLFPLFLVMNVNELTWGIFTLAGVISVIIAYAYFILMTKKYRQTLGKQLLGIKVFSYEAKELTWLDVIFREVVGRFIHQSLTFTNLLYLIVAFSQEKRGLHDRIGNTFVALEPRKTRTIPLSDNN